jgi:hypothetical protein
LEILHSIFNNVDGFILDASLLKVILYPYTTGSVRLPEYSDILRDHFIKVIHEELKKFTFSQFQEKRSMAL